MKKLLLLAFISLCLLNTEGQDKTQDWPNLSQFRQENIQLGQPERGEKRIVLMGNSITIGWSRVDPQFIKDNNLINRGISGQTTPQMLLRFRQDVVNLRPAAVFILAGINDLAGNTGPSSLEMIENNITDMALLAKISGIRVYLCSVLPANNIAWRGGMNPSEDIRKLNEWIRTFAKNNKFGYIDYYKELVDNNGGMPENLSKDGVHPTLAGYKIMEKAILPAIHKIRR